MNLRRNSLANIVDTAFFMLGVSLISRTTVVPPLVGRLTDSEVAIGLAPAPASGHAASTTTRRHFTEGLRRKMPFVVLFCVLRIVRVPILTCCSTRDFVLASRSARKAERMCPDRLPQASQPAARRSVRISANSWPKMPSQQSGWTLY